MNNNQNRRIIFIRSSGIFDDSRATKEIIALAEHGYCITVIGWDRSGLGSEKCRELFRGFDIEFAFYNEKVSGGIGFKGIKKLIGFFIYSRRELSKRGNDVYAVHACDLDGAVGVYKYCRKKRIPLIYDIYDYYIDSHSIPNILMDMVEGLEIKIINQSACTVICTEERKAQIAKANPKKIEVIYNSPDINDNEKYTGQNKYDYVYCGAFEERRLIEEILNDYINHKELKFIFAGSGKYDKQVELAAENPNFTFLGRIDYDTVLKVERESTIISAIYEPTVRNHVLCAPNKFYEALALGKPVIVCRGTGIDKIVERHRIGRVIDYSVDQFYQAIKSLLSDEKELVEISNRAMNLYGSMYKWSIMKGVLCHIYDTLV